MSYLFFRFSILFACLRKNPKIPFSSSSASNPFSSPTTFVSSSPTSPRSWDFTLLRASSEKSAIFFCVPAPYCIICEVFSTSIFAAKVFTISCSSGVRTVFAISFCTSSIPCISSINTGAEGSVFFSSIRSGSSVRDGIGIPFLSSTIFFSFCLFVLLFYKIAVFQSFLRKHGMQDGDIAGNVPGRILKNGI